MKKYYLLLIVILAMTSCKKWLDVQPHATVSANELFETQEGFEEALDGVYTRCAQTDLYGDELTVGLPEVLAQNYYISPASNPYSYLHTSQYLYTDATFINLKDAIWNGLYNGIVNANLILANIDQKKSLFTGNEYALIKGEALALRAYLHFDAFRLFGPAYSAGGSQKAIPYVTTYSNQVTAISSTNDVFRYAIADLDSAKQLLSAADSIRTPTYRVGYPLSGTDSVNSNGTAGSERNYPSLFLQNRRFRMNYYAVCAELARVYLYKGDKVNALANAEEVINANKFPWIVSSYATTSDPTKTDRIFFNELIFGWYIPKSQTNLQNRFENGNTSLELQTDDYNTLYEKNGPGAEDLRYKVWFLPSRDAGMQELLKYKRNLNADPNNASANLYPLTAPAIRKSEVYYIAAESSFSSNPGKALDYLNQVRASRGIPQQVNVTTEADFMNELVKEMRKETYGEGQIFYLYKRLNRNIPGPSGTVIPASNKIYELPLPNNEIEFGGR